MIGAGISLSQVALRPRALVSANMALAVPGWVSLARPDGALFWNASGHLESAGTDQPRVTHDPVSLDPQGLLIEPMATNLLTHSNIALGAGWSEGATSSTNLSLNALGMFDGVSVAGSGANWARLVHADQPSVVATQTYFFTLFYQAGTSGRIRVIFRSPAGQESRFAGPIGGALSVLSDDVGAISILSDQLLADGVSRVLSVSLAASVSQALSIGIGPDSTTAGETITLLGAQFEQGAQTSFIPTQGAAATRSADSAQVTGLSGVYDVHATYGDGSTAFFPAQQVDAGYWPALTKPVLKSLALRPVRAAV